MYQQSAKFPFQFRLNQWNLALSSRNKEIVYRFLNSNKIGNHILIFGANKTGKTSLGVAMANEASIQHKSCMYSTATKQIENFFEEIKANPINSELTFWNWSDASVLLIDDIQPAINLDEQLFSPEILKKSIEKTSQAEHIKTILRTKTVIWIIGTSLNYTHQLYDWKQFLLNELSIQDGSIFTVDLSEKDI